MAQGRFGPGGHVLQLGGEAELWDQPIARRDAAVAFPGQLLADEGEEGGTSLIPAPSVEVDNHKAPVLLRGRSEVQEILGLVRTIGEFSGGHAPRIPEHLPNKSGKARKVLYQPFHRLTL